MPFYRRVLLTSLCVMLCSGAVLAEAVPSSSPTPRTLDECIATALAQQTDVLIGQHALEASNARLTQTRSAYYPQITAQTTDNVVSSNRNGLDRDGASLTVTQNFYDGGLREARVASARQSVVQQDAVLARTKQSVIYNVTRTYTGLLRAQRLADVADRRVAYIEGQQQLIQGRIEAGDAAEVDALPIAAQLANARVDQLSARNAVRTASIQLQLAMGLTPGAPFPVQDITTPGTLMVDPLDTCLAQALGQRPELQQTQAAIGVASAAVKTARINTRPRPVISGQLGQPVFSDDDATYAISAGLVFDLFNGNSTRAAYTEAKSNLSTAELRAAQMGKEITAEVQDAYLNVTNAQERLTASALSVEAARRNADAQQARYAQGLAIPLDLLNAQLEVTTAESNAVQAQYDYVAALAQLHYAMGREGGISWE
jgi:outer membrane protein TolC